MVQRRPCPQPKNRNLAKSPRSPRLGILGPSALASRRRACVGFTLIETVTVLAIIAALFGIVFGIAEYVSQTANVGKVKSEFEQIHNAVQERFLQQGLLPDDTNLMTTALTNWLPNGFDGNDPWGNPYLFFERTGNSYELRSVGPDGIISNGDDVVSGY